MRRLVRTILHRANALAHSLAGPVLYEKLRFFQLHRYWPDLADPVSYSELVVAHKLRYGLGQDGFMVRTADKIAAREYIRERIGDAHIIPLLFTGEEPRDLPFDTLTPPYVIKPNNSCGRFVFVRSERDVEDRESVIRIMEGWSRQRYGSWLNERYYNAIPFAILVEPLLETEGQALVEYRFETFKGKVRFFYLETGRFRRMRRGVYSRELDYLDVQWKDAEKHPIPLPGRSVLEKMIILAEKVAEDLPQARIDMYLHQGRIYLGEIAHFPGSGRCPVESVDKDRQVGQILRHGLVPPELLGSRS